MAKSSTSYVCQACGSAHSKWAGKCEACGSWNSLVEEISQSSATSSPRARQIKGGKKIEFTELSVSTPEPPRVLTGMAELDRVTGGGLVSASAILIGGDPGIGKSTLLLHLAATLSRKQRAVYISGEESLAQIRLRARRLNVADAPVELAAATNLRDILASLDGPNPPAVVVIDSIQTLYFDALDSAPGTVAQVRACAQELIRLAKAIGFTLFLVGHVTKEGMIAGPKVLEHMVDTVLYFEGERGHHFRLLRAVKNRFGPTDEIGVFEMTTEGLSEVANPSALFLAERKGDVSGSCVFAGMEGTRPVLVEIQALVAPTSFGTPRRTVVGWDSGRLAMVTAVLETRAGVSLSMHDIYLNVAGGLRINEPAADMAVAAALISAVSGMAVPSTTVAFGEIGLTGEVRRVAQQEARLKEASKLGFKTALIPGGKFTRNPDMQLTAIEDVRDLLGELGRGALKKVQRLAG
ncbi:MAG: DNA repair protein RadA [Dongiaceae bacterium]